MTATLSPAAMIVRAGMMHDDGDHILDAVQMSDLMRALDLLPGDEAAIDAAWLELAGNPVASCPTGETIFEIFTAHDGRTQGFRYGEDVARQTCDRINPVGSDGLLVKGAPFHDFLPASHEGFYIADDRGFVMMATRSKPLTFPTLAQAQAAASKATMGSDTRTYSAVGHHLA